MTEAFSGSMLPLAEPLRSSDVVGFCGVMRTSGADGRPLTSMDMIWSVYSPLVSKTEAVMLCIP